MSMSDKWGLSILTWNINGIRATKLPLQQVLDALEADIVCLQETKITRDQLDEKTAILDGYNSYFSFSKVRSGYSVQEAALLPLLMFSVATYARSHVTPVKAEQGLTGLLSPEGSSAGDQNVGCYGNQSDVFTDDELMSLDREGRCVITEHKIRLQDQTEKSLVIINVYCPRADPEKPERLTFKLRYYQLLQLRAEELVKQGRHVIILGDMNTSHKKIDHCDPDNDEEFYNDPGRQWMDALLHDPDMGDSSELAIGDVPAVPTVDKNPLASATPDEFSSEVESEGHHLFIDSFRFLHRSLPDAFTNWCSRTGARATNYGCRLDYILLDCTLARTVLTSCIIMPEVQGSDHCPVRATLSCSIIPAVKCPPLCTRYMPEFSGRQQKMLAFLTKRPSSQSSAGFPDTDLSRLSDSQMSQSSVYNIEINNSPASNEILCRTNESNVTVAKHSDNGVVQEQQPKITEKTVKRGNASSVGKKLPTAGSGKHVDLMNFFTKRIKCDDTLNSECSAVNTDKKLICSVSSPVSRNETIANHPSEAAVCKAAFKSMTPEVKLQSECKPSLNSTTSANAWRGMLKGPPQAPLCKGHGEPCVLRDVKKDGANKGRQFWVCCRPEGHKSNPAARCDHFTWVPTSLSSKKS